MLLAGLTAVIGSVVDWVTVTPPPEPPAGVNFEDQPFAPEENSEPFNGLEAGDGWLTVAGGGVQLASGLLLITMRRGGWIGILASIPIGAIAISAYRSLDSPTSRLFEKTGTVGDVDPALGLSLIAAAGLVGLISAVIGVAATPRSQSV